MRFSIDKQLLEDIVNYMVTKPYNEVQAIITSIQNDIKPILKDAKSEEE